MHLKRGAVLVCLIATAALGQDSRPAVDETQMLEAEALLQKMAEAYRNAPTVTDSITMVVESPMGPMEYDVDLSIGTGTNAQVSFPGWTFTALDGQFYAISDEVENKYLQTELKGDLRETLMSLFGGEGTLPIQFDLRSPRSTPEIIELLGVGFVMNPRITGLAKVESESGEASYEITLGGDQGSVRINISRDEHLIRSLDFESRPPGAPPSAQTMKGHLQFSPQLGPTLENPITFNPGERRMVDEISNVVPVAVGDPAPDFTLQDLDGETVRLSELRGSVVVLDFWATWCGPCKMALPHLEKFASWADSSNEPIRVFAVNVMERGDANSRLRIVRDYWSSQKFTMRTLLDSGDTVVQAYAVTSIPMTIIVGPDGIVTHMHNGFSKDMVERLKKDTAESLETSG